MGPVAQHKPAASRHRRPLGLVAPGTGFLPSPPAHRQARAGQQPPQLGRNCSLTPVRPQLGPAPTNREPAI
ncbi:hypothetical protein L209DRAFT_751773 [Thermothelomyces heterothallicus CBS 203.75]